jgi:hypothetical protein
MFVYRYFFLHQLHCFLPLLVFLLPVTLRECFADFSNLCSLFPFFLFSIVVEFLISHWVILQFVGLTNNNSSSYIYMTCVVH